MSDTNLVKEAEKYIAEKLEVTEDEAKALDAGNTWLARINGNSAPPGSWRPNRVVRPQNLQVSRTQLRGIGVNHGQ